MELLIPFAFSFLYYIQLNSSYTSRCMAIESMNIPGACVYLDLHDNPLYLDISDVSLDNITDDSIRKLKGCHAL